MSLVTPFYSHAPVETGRKQNLVVWFLIALKKGPKRIPALYPPGSERYSTRSLEAHLSVIDVVFGLLVMLPYWNTLEQPIYAPLLQLVPSETFWGGILLARGLVHLVALRINGHAWWTPFMRAFASTFSGLLFAVFAIVLTWATPFVPGLIFTLAVVSTVAHLYCCRRSGRDAGIAWDLKRSRQR